MAFISGVSRQRWVLICVAKAVGFILSCSHSHSLESTGGTRHQWWLFPNDREAHLSVSFIVGEVLLIGYCGGWHTGSRWHMHSQQLSSFHKNKEVMWTKSLREEDTFPHIFLFLLTFLHHTLLSFPFYFFLIPVLHLSFSSSSFHLLLIYFLIPHLTLLFVFIPTSSSTPYSFSVLSLI